MYGDIRFSTENVDERMEKRKHKSHPGDALLLLEEV
jgi:hypothetical protein